MTNCDLTRFWAPVLILFQIFALVPCKLKTSPILLIIYNIFLPLVLLLVITYTWLVQIPSIVVFNLYAVMDITLIVAIQLTHMITIFEVHISGSVESEILNNIHRIFEMITEQINYPIDVAVLRRSCARKCWTVFGVGAGFMLFGSSLYFNVFWEYWGPTYYSWHVMNVRKIQVYFYVDLLTELLIYLRTVLKSINDVETPCGRLMTILRSQRIYMEIQKTSSMISRVFAWSLIAILLQCVIELMNNMYWLIINIYYTKSLLHVTSK